MTDFGRIVSSKASRPLRLNGSTVWDALGSAPPGSHLSLTVGGVPESSATTVREMIARSTNIDDLCHKINQSLTLWVSGVNEWHPALVRELCSDYGVAIWDQGLTDGKSRCDIFAGEYASTPGGIHREPCWNRHLVVHGRKCFYFWDHEALQGNGAYENVATYPTENGDEQYLETISIHDIVSSALEIRATPGCYLHWPNWVWHIAETPDPCLSVNIASYGSSSAGVARALPIVRSNEGEVPAEWVAEYREFNQAFRALDADVIISAVSASGLICPRLRVGEDVQDIIRTCAAACRVTNAPAVWVRHGDRIVVGLAGQAIAITGNGEGAPGGWGPALLTRTHPRRRAILHFWNGSIQSRV